MEDSIRCLDELGAIVPTARVGHWQDGITPLRMAPHPTGLPFEVVAKRTVDQSSGEIVEDSWHGKELHKTLFRLRAGTLVFGVSDENMTFEGTVTSQTKDWL
jgi:hypothetical protein